MSANLFYINLFMKSKDRNQVLTLVCEQAIWPWKHLSLWNNYFYILKPFKVTTYYGILADV